MKFGDSGSLGDLPRDCTDRYIPVYTVYRLVYTGIYRYILYRRVYTCIYWYILCTDWYIPVYTCIYFHCYVAVTQGLSLRRRALKCATLLLTTLKSPRKSRGLAQGLYRLVYTGIYYV
jgi:hypothetical protein